ncbi:MAG: insulinase family protein [Gemmatimonadaceae bacterium]|nr:insulinase family protein [Gemmatimonadaceae bacterium]
MSGLHAILPPDSVRRCVLPNGLTVLARRDASAPVVSIVTWVGAGYFDEPDDVVGIAHVLEHMYFKGTPTRGVGEIARATKAAGGYLNAGTIYDHTHYYTVLPSSGFTQGLDVQADAYAHSVIDAGELARELEVIIEETKRKADTPAALAVETLFEVLHDRHRIRRWRMGREHELRALTRDQLVGFYRHYYRPSNTVLAIVGDVDPDVAIAEATRRYGAIADAPVTRVPGPEETAPPGFRVREWEGDIAQAELLLGWRTPPTAHADTPALDVLATVLAGGRASRLVRAARDRRLVSSVSAYDYTPTALGVFVVHAGARPADLPAAARALWDQMRRVREGEVTEAELARARCLLEAQWLRRLESADGQANFLGAWELAGGWERGIAYYEALLAVDAARIAEVARRWLGAEEASVVCYRPRGSRPLGDGPGAVRALLEAERPAAIEPTGAPVAAPALIGAGARLERVVDDVHVFRTAGDVPVLVKRRPGAALAHFGCFIDGGGTEEREADGGVTTLMARAALRGTVHRSASRLAEDAERLGGVPGASSGTETMQWTMGVPARHFAAAAELVADLVLAPTFPADGVEAERAVAKAALAQLRDDMYRQPIRLAGAAAWPGHPYGRSTLGSESSIAALTREDLVRWHARQVPESAAVLVAVGDLDPQEAADVLAKRFAALRARAPRRVAPPDWPAAAQVEVEERDKAQTALAILFPGPAQDDPLRFDAELIAGVASGLGGRFFEELRDRQSLAYTVHVRPFVRRAGGAFAAYIATSPAKEAQAREGLLREFARLVEEEITDAELRQARTFAIGSWQIRQSSGAAVLGEIADAWMHDDLGAIARYPADLASVTTARMREAAARWFDPARRIEGIVRGRTAG